MKILSTILLFISISAFGADLFPAIPKDMLKATHRLSALNKKTRTTGWGACVSVDLSAYGLVGKRFIITAAHCVNDDGKMRAIMIEVIKDGKKEWISAYLLAMDENMDIAILITEEDLPVQLSLDTLDAVQVGDAIITIGAPRAQPLTGTIGFLADKGAKSKEQTHANWYQGSNTITHGNSGGPVFNANTNEIVGIVTAVIGGTPDNPSEAPNICLFVGAPDVIDFIKNNLPLIEKNIEKSKKLFK